MASLPRIKWWFSVYSRFIRDETDRMKSGASGAGAYKNILDRRIGRIYVDGGQARQREWLIKRISFERVDRHDAASVEPERNCRRIRIPCDYFRRMRANHDHAARCEGDRAEI